jgi:hypothetical protein
MVGNTSNPFLARMPFVLAGKLVSGLKKSLPARKKTILVGASHQTPSIDANVFAEKGIQ